LDSYGRDSLMGGAEMKELITKDNICAMALGVSLLACIFLGYNDNVACTIAGSLGGVITGKALAGGGTSGERKS
jgi:hypothetical protein